MNHENDLGDVRYGYMHVGEVIQRDDPLGLARVRIRIPGLVDRTGWAFPLGMPGGGGKGVGLKMVPRLKAEVAVFFKGGSPDHPYYLSAQWGAPGGQSEMPTALLDLNPKTDKPEDVDVLETERFQMVFDNRSGHETFRIRDKVSGDMIEFDGTKATGPGITIQASAGLILKVDGAFVVDAISAVINGRKVTDGAQNL